MMHPDALNCDYVNILSPSCDNGSVDQPLILDRYRPLRDLASGGFADVVLAFDTKMHRRVAIKRLPLPHGGRRSAPDVRIGLAEARTVALLSHPNIVTVHEWDADSDEAFLIMEFVDGATVADLLDELGPFDLDEAAAVVDAVASALTYAHDNGVLHLDIKPENVLVTRDGHVKVTDFGVAALSSAAGHGPSVGGTLGFMPLEQLRGEEVDERTDVWAFAALAFEMLTDANPFASDTVEGAIFKAAVVDPAPPSEFEPSLSDAIDDILLVALDEHADQRYPSVAEFADRLLDHLGDAAAGRASLAQAAYDMTEEIEPDVHPRGAAFGVGLWDRLLAYRPALVRGAAAAVSAWLAWSGLAPFDLGLPATAGAAALVAIGGAAMPALGTLLGLFAFGAGIAKLGAPWAAAAFVALAAAAWWFAGRRELGLLPACAAPSLGGAHCAPAAPLIAGFAQAPRQAAVNGAMAALFAMLSSAASGGAAPYVAVSWAWLAGPLSDRLAAARLAQLLSTPAPLGVVAGWTVAALAMSLSCRRSSRVAALVGTALGTVSMYGGYAAADTLARATGSQGVWTGTGLLPHLTASSILMVLIVMAGPPTRPEEETASGPARG